MADAICVNVKNFRERIDLELNAAIGDDSFIADRPKLDETFAEITELVQSNRSSDAFVVDGLTGSDCVKTSL